MTELTEKFLDSTLETEDIFREVNRYLLEFRGWGRNKRDDFITDHYNEIKDITRKFVFKGSPLEAYLHASLRFFIINRRRKRQRESHREGVFRAMEKSERRACYREMVDQNTGEETPVYGPCLLKTTEKGVIKKETERKRMLYLVLYNCYYLDDRQIEQAGTLLGMKTEKLMQMIQDMKTISFQAHERYTELKNVKSKAYFKLRKLELLWARTEDPASRQMLGELGRAQKQRLKRAADRLASCRHSPSHKEIARYLNIPKGTVDSGFFYLGKTMKKG